MSTAAALRFLLLRRLRNRVRRIREKLREPTYLIGLLLVFGYLGFILLTRVFAAVIASGRPAPPEDPRDAMPWATHVVMPIGFLLLSAYAWLPIGSSKLHPLGFERSDCYLLFPAPISRRWLILYRLVAVQPGLVFSATLFTVLVRPTAHVLGFVGFFLFLEMIWLHRAVAAIAHGLPPDTRPFRRLVSWLPGLVIGGIVIAIASSVDWAELVAGDDPLAEVRALGQRASVRWALLPYDAIATVLRGSEGALLSWPVALGVCAGLLGLHVLWLFANVASFEEASLASAELRAEMRAAFQKGRIGLGLWRRGGPVRGQPFRLAATGARATAFVWKGLIAAGRYHRPRTLVLGCAGAALLGWLAPGLAEGFGIDGRLTIVPAILISAMPLAFSLGGRSQEGAGTLDTMALLRPLPVSGRSVAAGGVLAEVLAGALLYAFGLAFAIAWAGAIWGAAGALPAAAIGGGAVALAMGVLGIVSAVRLAIAYRFPAVGRLQVGPEAFGPNLLVMVVRAGSLSVLLTPVGAAAGCAGGIGFVTLGRTGALAGAIAGPLVVVAVEIVALIVLAGRFYDRFDVSTDDL